MTVAEFLQHKADRLRLHSLRITTESGSGHPTSCLSCAEIMSVLFFHEMKYDPNNMASFDNDEFVMSKGHAAPILYAALAEAGIIPLDKTLKLRSFSSPIEGHPVPRIPGIRVATGSLGQGLSIGVGMALAMKLDGLNRKVYVLMGDGETSEGSVWEAMNLASNLKLDNICVILDVNRLGQSEPTMHQWDTEKYANKAESFGWNTIITDGHSVEDLINAFDQVGKDRPVFIIAKTVKGKGVSFLENKEGQHGKAVGKDMVENAINEIQNRMRVVEDEPKNLIKSKSFLKEKRLAKISMDYKLGENVATRDSYGKALVKLGDQDPDMIVLDGDVKNSTFTEYFFQKYPERSFQCYIAEQNMIGTALGLQALGKNVFTATFAAFLTRAFDQLRMAAYSRANIKIAGSHSGVSIGEDGPSQMGLEDISFMRTLFNSIVLYPADGVAAEKLTELSANYNGISYIRTTRPKTPIIYDNSEEFVVGGSKVLRKSDNDSVTIVSAGITLHEALKAADELKKEGISARVIDCYSIKPIDEKTLLQAAHETGNIITVEDHYPQGGLGETVASVVTDKCTVHMLSVKIMPHSGKPEELLAEQGIDKNGIVKKVKELI
ncbi:MAG: transketolase [Candidatus Aenigmatarchaeota archaeon]